mmetsp:Transcript_16786/g.25369  ORF Transcript_16786/g.25369 Transcript_16786/m.25369 type:complete len:264 (+) Transcript_16786:154-945(+)|eukprot:CAMPEP_0178932968 /NCGR_PEP_ID=MMETSP0786-20121207/22966_1 /TAXON_ID=186022 /ORGANISM="Thalassionema frauenfeldii, Strain CCMP 1798" /LENGTH=263 /DNA_ID=CAMNT_0020610427 /DNA_START=35 /DNA_END=829 /DNA_ORIENTATION=-
MMKKMEDEESFKKQQQQHSPDDDICSSSITIVEKPRPDDVLCGRGKACFDHVGNDSFRLLIAQHVDSYENAPSKKAKMDVIMQVVDVVVSRGGRFLLKNNKEKEVVWIDGGVKQGKKKTGHALRDALRGRVKCISELRAHHNHHHSEYHPQDITTKKISPPLYYNNVIIPEPARMPSFEEEHSSPYSGTSDERIMNNPRPDVAMKFEPERQWRRNSEIDNEFKQDLLQFFTSTDGKEQVPSSQNPATLSKKRKKDIVKMEPEI